MHDFLLKKLSNSDIEKELLNIGYDKSYASKAKDKFEYQNLKIFNLSCAQANILKQIALSVGADCGTHRDVILGKIEQSNAILGGNLSQLRKISQKLQYQPFGLKNLGQKIQEIQFCADKRTKIIGILNVTSDSFSDGGKYYEYKDATEHLNKLIEDGADIIDIGAESTRPGAHNIDANEQIERIVPILKYIKANKIEIPISIDTRSSIVAQKCINYGINIINDVSGFDYDEKMVDITAQNPNVKIIIQHSQGTPENMQKNPHYENLMDDIFINLKHKVEYAVSKGTKIENIIIDPGIGFGKTTEDNFEILNRWEELRSIGCPILIGLSRKSLLNMKDADNTEKDIYTLALNSILIHQNIDYIRVHNVKFHKKLIKMLNNNRLN